MAQMQTRSTRPLVSFKSSGSVGHQTLAAYDVGIRLIGKASSILTGNSPQAGRPDGSVEHEMGK